MISKVISDVMNIKRNLKSEFSLSKAGKFGVMIGLIFMLSTVAFAQRDLGDPDDTVVPIDGGVSILLAAGVGYGIKKIQETKKQKQKNNDIVDY